MDKLKVAIITEEPSAAEGGGYSYYQMMFAAINDYSFHPDIEITNISLDKDTRERTSNGKRVIKVKKTFVEIIADSFLNFLYSTVHYLLKKNAGTYLDTLSGFIDAINNRAITRILVRENIHLVYYLKPKENLVNYPMIVTHWDVGHKSMYPFPEVGWNGNFEKRERYYNTILNKAFLILCESNTGAKELQSFYPVNPAKIKVLPLFAGDVINYKIEQGEQAKILGAYNLIKENFFVYPAQFWAHKNHATLIHAFRLLLTESLNKTLQLVLCGSDQGNLEYIKNLVKELDLINNVSFPGFISNRSLNVLYQNAIALVMPTFLGPTNLPLIEAAQLHCAILCSNLAGHKELLGNNVLYFDPSSADEIKSCMVQVLNVTTRRQLVSSAYEHVSNSDFRVERSIPLLDRFLQDIKPIRKAWGMHLKLFITFAKIGMLSFTS